MFHAHTLRVLDEWTRRRGPARRLPARTELSPMLFGPLLPQIFILGDDGEAGWRFRLAGAFVTDLHGRPLKGEPFAALWTPKDQPRVLQALETARRAAEPRILAARGETDFGDALSLEVTLAPVTGPTEIADRVLGLCQPLSLTARLRGEPLTMLSLTGARSPTALAASPALRLVVDNTRPAPLG